MNYWYQISDELSDESRSSETIGKSRSSVCRVVVSSRARWQLGAKSAQPKCVGEAACSLSCSCVYECRPVVLLVNQSHHSSGGGRVCASLLASGAKLYASLLAQLRIASLT